MENSHIYYYPYYAPASPYILPPETTVSYYEFPLVVDYHQRESDTVA